ncbi:MAG: type II toxin-antitoxin system VapC family toxin [Anaerolineae bacterium]|nr:type II toxin-antitoxin system VapC family toxin [Anaerolineae bacterium]
MEQTRYVIDANIGISLYIDLPYSLAARNFLQRVDRNPNLLVYVPPLWFHEIVSVTRKIMVVKGWSLADAQLAMKQVLGLNVIMSDPVALWERTLIWADRIGSSKAYDASYIALAEILDATFYTADERFYKSASPLASFIELIS